jgi:hypothetical protein
MFKSTKFIRSHKLEAHHQYHKDSLLYNHVDVSMIKAQKILSNSYMRSMNFVLSKSWQGTGWSPKKRERTSK